MGITSRSLTYDDLLLAPEDDGNRYEIIGGELFISRDNERAHVWTTANALSLLANHAQQRDLGKVFVGPVDVRLTPYDILVPDIIFIRGDRAYIFGDRLVDGPPEFVVEIISPTTRRRDLTDKRRLYARAGVAEFLIVDPDAKSVQLLALTAKGEYEAVAPVEGRLASRVLAGLVVEPAVLFDGLP